MRSWMHIVYRARSFPASRGLFSVVFAELTGTRKRDLCPGSKRTAVTQRPNRHVMPCYYAGSLNDSGVKSILTQDRGLFSLRPSVQRIQRKRGLCKQGSSEYLLCVSESRAFFNSRSSFRKRVVSVIGTTCRLCWK